MSRPLVHETCISLVSPSGSGALLIWIPRARAALQRLLLTSYRHRMVFFTLHSCSMRRSLDCQQKSLYRVCTGYARSGRVSSRPALFSHWRLPVSPVTVQSTLGTRARCVVQFLEHYANVLRHQYVAGVLSCCLQSRKLFIAVYIYIRVAFPLAPRNIIAVL